MICRVQRLEYYSVNPYLPFIKYKLQILLNVDPSKGTKQVQ